jgi:FkbM family methyltransferase
MKNAVFGYYNIYRKNGIKRAIRSFYEYYYTKFKVNQRKKQGNYIVKTHGCFMEVNPNDEGLSTELIAFGSHEPNTTKFVEKYLKNEMNCIDIGANIGYYSTLYSKKIGKNGKVISIEPSPENFIFLEKNLEMQKMKNYSCYNVACGNYEDTVNFCVDKRANKCFVIENKENMPPNYEIISVPVKTIDQIIKNEQFEKIDFIKIDVEGFELNVLEGAKNLIQKYKPTIQIEIHCPKLGLNISRKILQIFLDESYEIIFFNEKLYKEFKEKEGSKKMNLKNLISYIPNHNQKISFKIIMEYQKK